MTLGFSCRDRHGKVCTLAILVSLTMGNGLLLAAEDLGSRAAGRPNPQV